MVPVEGERAAILKYTLIQCYLHGNMAFAGSEPDQRRGHNRRVRANRPGFVAIAKCNYKMIEAYQRARKMEMYV